MKTLTKRLLSLIMVIAVVITGLPFTVMAETNTNTGNEGITIDLSATGESLDEILSNISGLNALANDANTTSSTAKNPEEVADSKTDCDKKVIIDAVVDDAVEKEEDTKEEIKFDSGSGVEAPATDFRYTITDSKVTITKYIGSATEVVIPAEIEGYPVTSIGGSAFFKCSELTSITIPEGVTSIGNYAFEYCSALTRITLPEGLTSIGPSAFRNCSTLTSITLPEGVTSIWNYAFRSCSSLVSITIPESVTSIGEGAFRDCSALTSITLPEGVTSIVSETFYKCSSLKSISIPDSVKSIGSDAFSGCSALTSITLPEGVTSIGNRAFDGCSALTSITLPDGVTSIGGYAFRYCRSLTSITIPEGVTSIGSDAFSECSALTSITLPDGVTSIGDSAFSGCSALTSITIPEGVMSIGETAFKGCSALTCITIPEGVTSIGRGAFSGCRSLTSITLPIGVTSIGIGAFAWCNKLIEIYYTGTEDDWNNIEISDNNDMLINAPVHYEVAHGSGFTRVTHEATCTINKNVTQHCNYCDSVFEAVTEKETATGHNYVNGLCENCGLVEAFPLSYEYNNGTIEITDCNTSVTEVTIPTTIEGYPVTSIGWQAFGDCSALTSIVIPKGVTSIGWQAFAWCRALRSITIPEGVTSIGDSAFESCNKLNHVYYTGTESDWNNIEISDNNDMLINALVHYEVTPGSEFTTVTHEATCTINKKITQQCNYCDSAFEVVTEKETATGHNYVNGVCENCGLVEAFPLSYEYNNGTIKITDCNTSVTEVVIPAEIEGYPVTSIGERAFYGCSALTRITIPEGVTSIGDYAFYGCSALTSITIPEGATSIGDYAFYECSALTSMTIPEGVTSIGDSVFDSCSSLTSILIPEGVMSIGGYAFDSCYSLTSIVIPERVTSIGGNAFRYCSSLTNITIPQGVTSIGDSAFEYCRSLTNVTLFKGLTSIGDSAFENCSSLSNIIIPETVTNIGEGAFCFCTNLENITIPNGVLTIGSGAFGYCSSLISIEISESVTSVGSSFLGCTALTSINVSEKNKNYSSMDGVLFNKDKTQLIHYPTGKFGKYTVSYGVTNITIPEGVTSIGKNAFENHTSLSSITIPSSVINIAESAFWSCELNHVYYTGSETEWSNIEIGEYNDNLTNAVIHYDVITGKEISQNTNNATCNVDKNDSICCNYCNLPYVYVVEEGTATGHSYKNDVCDKCGLSKSFPLSYEFTDSGIKITDCSFSATTVVIPSTIEGYPVTSIGDSAFKSCSSLISITIPDSVQVIEYINDMGNTYCEVFKDCKSLKSIEVSENNNNYSSIDGVLFNKNKTTLICCPAAKTGKYTIPDGVNCIEMYAFENCSKLTSITFPESLNNIEYYNSYYAQDHILYAFDGCSSLESIEVSQNNSVFSSVDGVLFNKQKTRIIYCPAAKTGEFIILEGVTSIESSTFIDCHSLISITIPEGVTYLSDNLFTFGSLKSVTLPSSLTTIKHDSNGYLNHIYYTGTEFEWNNITIYSEEGKFGYKLSVVDWLTDYLNNPTVHYEVEPGTEYIKTIENEGSCTINKRESVYCKCCNSLISNTEYKATATGHDYLDGTCVNCGLPENFPLSYEFNNGEIIITGCDTTVITVDIPATIEGYPVTSIGERAFEYCRSLTSITIPEGVMSIGNWAFYYCSALTSITIPESVTTIGIYAFAYCSALTSITIPEGVTSIGNWAFYYCSALTSINIPEKVTGIGFYAFESCVSLTNIMVSENNTVYSSIEGVLFNKEEKELICCPAGKSGEYIIPDNVTKIKDRAFYGCSSLVSVVIPESVVSIEGNVFAYCSSLTSITIVENNKNYSYADGALFNKDATSLICFIASKTSEFTIPDSVTRIEDTAFDGQNSLKSVIIPDSVEYIGFYSFMGCRELTDVYYTGTAEQWNSLTSNNSSGMVIFGDDVTFHFNYSSVAIPEEITPSEGSNVVVDTTKSLVSGIAAQSKPADVIAQFEGSDHIQIVGKDGKALADDALVGTGCKIQLVENGEVLDEVTVVIKGEIDGNGKIDSDDAIYLLRNTLFASLYPVVVDDDVDGNGEYNSDDAIHLLRHTLFPSMYPLK